MQLTHADLQTLRSSMLSSSLTAQSVMMTSSTSSSASGQQRLRRALRCMPALGASAWYAYICGAPCCPPLGPVLALLAWFQQGLRGK
jgi:hypothetical protein